MILTGTTLPPAKPLKRKGQKNRKPKRIKFHSRKLTRSVAKQRALCDQVKQQYQLDGVLLRDITIIQERAYLDSDQKAPRPCYISQISRPIEYRGINNRTAPTIGLINTKKLCWFKEDACTKDGESQNLLDRSTRSRQKFISDQETMNTKLLEQAEKQWYQLFSMTSGHLSNDGEWSLPKEKKTPPINLIPHPEILTEEYNRDNIGCLVFSQKQFSELFPNILLRKYKFESELGLPSLPIAIYYENEGRLETYCLEDITTKEELYELERTYRDYIELATITGVKQEVVGEIISHLSLPEAIQLLRTIQTETMKSNFQHYGRALQLKKLLATENDHYDIEAVQTLLDEGVFMGQMNFKNSRGYSEVLTPMEYLIITADEKRLNHFREKLYTPYANAEEEKTAESDAKAAYIAFHKSASKLLVMLLKSGCKMRDPCCPENIRTYCHTLSITEDPWPLSELPTLVRETLKKENIRRQDYFFFIDSIDIDSPGRTRLLIERPLPTYFSKEATLPLAINEYIKSETIEKKTRWRQYIWIISRLFSKKDFKEELKKSKNHLWGSAGNYFKNTHSIREEFNFSENCPEAQHFKTKLKELEQRELLEEQAKQSTEDINEDINLKNDLCRLLEKPFEQPLIFTSPENQEETTRQILQHYYRRPSAIMVRKWITKNDCRFRVPLKPIHSCSHVLRARSNADWYMAILEKYNIITPRLTPDEKHLLCLLALYHDAAAEDVDKQKEESVGADWFERDMIANGKYPENLIKDIANALRYKEDDICGKPAPANPKIRNYLHIIRFADRMDITRCVGVSQNFPQWSPPETHSPDSIRADLLDIPFIPEDIRQPFFDELTAAMHGAIDLGEITGSPETLDFRPQGSISTRLKIPNKEPDIKHKIQAGFEKTPLPLQHRDQFLDDIVRLQVAAEAGIEPCSDPQHIHCAANRATGTTRGIHNRQELAQIAIPEDMTRLEKLQIADRKSLSEAMQAKVNDTIQHYCREPLHLEIGTMQQHELADIKTQEKLRERGIEVRAVKRKRGYKDGSPHYEEVLMRKKICKPDHIQTETDAGQ